MITARMGPLYTSNEVTLAQLLLSVFFGINSEKKAERMKNEQNNMAEKSFKMKMYSHSMGGVDVRERHLSTYKT